MSVVIGWDIGGAHLKAARAEQGRVVAVVQLPSPLRLGLDALKQAFGEAKARLGRADRHAVTMTGELADTFASRREGVAEIAALAVRELGALSLYAGRAGFIAADLAEPQVEDVASANWFASAALVAHVCGSALLVDMGSTTTDIVRVHNRKVAARGYTDAERLAAGELVYTGLTRSFLMALVQCAPFAGAWTALVNENFANMADVHRILGLLPDGADQMATADGRPKTIEASRARLARVVGRDAADADAAQWSALAHWFAEAQMRAIQDGAMQVLSGIALAPDAPVVTAGVGAARLREVARRLGRTAVDFHGLLPVDPAIGEAVTQCAPAAALAILAST